MRSTKLVVIHFAPLEFYPPIQNLLGELEKSSLKIKTWVITSLCTNLNLRPFSLPNGNSKIFRSGIFNGKDKKILRYLNYLFFFTSSLVRLIIIRPKKILYFETISSFPAYLYKRFFNNACQVLIHYHEYTSPAEYQSGMLLVKYFHRYEKWLYPRAAWVSHTNNFRMTLFKKDVYPVEIRNAQILPNYPPLSWKSMPKSSVNYPIRIVYVGSLSLTTMYTEEFSKWVVGQNGKVLFDMYSYNCTSEAETFIKQLKSPWITLKDGVNYDRVPAILKDYDVGMILYNGHIPNYVYNAPNKLFEYLASGLDVWFPDVMIGCLDYTTNLGNPKVLSIDFKDLNAFDLETAMEKGLQISENRFFCEIALDPLLTYMTHD
jgi:hypothetical protein